MQATADIEAMSGSELLDHVDLLHQSQRRAEVQILEAAAQHAVLHNPDTLDPAVSRLNGRERAKRFGGHGTPEVAEFAAADFGARVGLSPYGGRELVADSLDLHHRHPRLWERVQALEVKVSYARFVTRRTRDLTLEQAMYVDSRVAESADGRISWSRFESLVDAAIVAADPDAAAERDAKAARHQFAKSTRSDDNGIRGFYIRAHFAVIARLDATVAYIAEALARLGDESSVDDRRVKAVLILANPAQAVELLAAYAAWRARPDDPPMPADETDQTDDAAAGAARDADKPEIDWSRLLPAVRVFVHLYGERDSDGVARVEGLGPVTESWVSRHLGASARFTITPVVDLAGQAPVDAYEIPERHRQAVHLMTPADIFPYSSCLSREKQIDHTVPFRDGGESTVGNYGPMTTSHHRIKTHGGWQVQQPFPGIYVWRDPHGEFYLVDHTGTRRIDDATSAPRGPASRLESHFSRISLRLVA